MLEILDENNQNTEDYADTDMGTISKSSKQDFKQVNTTKNPLNCIETSAEKLEIMDHIDSKSNIRFKTCERCQGSPLKPPRAYHCKMCDTCCMKMDHHCYWLGNCVGLYNTQYFF